MAECLQLFVEMYRGHGCGVFNAATDSVLAEFPIMVSAAKCAVNVQA
jgi:hypothetical protein